ESSPSRYACSIPSSTCDMLTPLSRLVGLDQPPARTGQRGADRAAREPRLSGDCFVRNTRVPQQQYLPVARRELFQRGADAGALVLDVERVENERTRVRAALEQQIGR